MRTFGSKTKSFSSDNPPQTGLELVLSGQPPPPSVSAGPSERWHPWARSYTCSSITGEERGEAILEAETQKPVVPSTVEESPQPTATQNPSSKVRAEEIEHAASLLKQPNQSFGFTVRSKAWNLLENPESSFAASVLARIIPPFIVATVILTLLETLDPPPLDRVFAAVLETSVESLFLLEFLVRLACCPNFGIFFCSPYNLIDLAAAAPLAVRAAMGFVLPDCEIESVPHAILVCAVPIVRLLKTLRRFEKFQLILRAFDLAAEALPVLLFILSLIALVFAMLIYIVEPRDNIQSLPKSMWFTIVTMTTVGYGDVTPESAAGSCVTGILVVVTVLYMAIPLGIIGNAFTVTWEQRDRILLMQRTRDRLRQWGYSAHDIPALFQISDANDDGELDVKEFRQLLTRMQIGFSEERILNLFHSFDNDKSGTVDDREFVRALFPHAYHEVYHDDVDDEQAPKSEELFDAGKGQRKG